MFSLKIPKNPELHILHTLDYQLLKTHSNINTPEVGGSIPPFATKKRRLSFKTAFFLNLKQKQKL